MRRGRVFIYLALILILGLAGFVVVWQKFLAPSMGQTTEEVVPTPVIQTVNVIVTTQRVPRGVTLSESVLGVVPIQQELFFDGMFTSISEVEGKLAKFDLEAGIPLTRGMLADSGAGLSATGSIAALSIPRGMVAVSIPISRLSSVSYAPKPGDHVNVIVSMMFVDLDTDFQTILPNLAGSVIAPGTISELGPNFLTAQINGPGEAGPAVGRIDISAELGQSVYVVPSERQRPRMVSQSLLQDTIVLHVGNFPIEEEQAAEPAEPADVAAEEEVPADEAQATPAPPPPPDVITLVVTPQDAISLNYLIYSGAQLTLALRPAGDDTRVQTESVTLQFLLEQYNISVPARLPNGLEPAARELVPPAMPNVQPTPEP